MESGGRIPEVVVPPLEKKRVDLKRRGPKERRRGQKGRRGSKEMNEQRDTRPEKEQLEGEEEREKSGVGSQKISEEVPRSRDFLPRKWGETHERGEQRKAGSTKGGTGPGLLSKEIVGN